MLAAQVWGLTQYLFQSLKRDRGGSCFNSPSADGKTTSFNPSNGIGVVHAHGRARTLYHAPSFNPSNGIGVVHALAGRLT